MDLPRYQSSYLLTQFREFYREMDRLRRRVAVARLEAPALGGPDTAETQRLTPGPSIDGASYGVATAAALAPTAAIEPPVPAVWQELLTLLERQALEAGQGGGAFAFEIYREAQYVMAALADEVFLNLHWEGRNSWPLLEARLFQTHYAGEALFQRLDRLLQRRDPFYTDLAAVYFMALSLDFKGKYRDNDPSGRLEHYRQQLFAMIYRRNPQLFSSNTPLFPQALQHTLDEGPGRRLPDRRVWLGLTAGVIVAWLAISGWTWTALDTPVSCLICKVMNANCVCDAGGQ